MAYNRHNMSVFVPNCCWSINIHMNVYIVWTPANILTNLTKPLLHILSPDFQQRSNIIHWNSFSCVFSYMPAYTRWPIKSVWEILSSTQVCRICVFIFLTLMGEFTTSLMEFGLAPTLLPSSHSSFLLLCLQEVNPFHRQAHGVNLHYPYERLYSLPVVVAQGSGVSGLC